MNHAFTDKIIFVLGKSFGENLAEVVLKNSPLLLYLNEKTRSANSGSKARGSFANHYALYVLVEDYINKGYLNEQKGTYDLYEGARFSELLRRQRELPFGAKLQNHALNARLNDEFTKFFPTLGIRPIIRDVKEQRYWINENLLFVTITYQGKEYTINIAQPIIDIINLYIETKRSAFESFIESCQKMAKLDESSLSDAINFIQSQLQPHIDARIFEIVTYSILKAHYGEKSIFWGWNPDELQEESLLLYKTGRTNANDGGIDFVMKPLGRFFQVTETIDVNKYFLDIDKIQRYPLTFVVKTLDDPEIVRMRIEEQAKKKYRIERVVTQYLESIEEIINIPQIISIFDKLIQTQKLHAIMIEIIRQSRVEFNYDDDTDEEDVVNDPQV